MAVPVHLALVIGALLVAPAVLPSAGNAGGEAEYDVLVVTRVEWHNHLRYWEVDEPVAKETTKSRLFSYKAFLSNMLFFGGSDAKTFRVTLLDEAGATVSEVTQKTPEGNRWAGTEEYLKVVLRRVPEGSYTLRAQILEEDGRVLSQAAAKATVGGA